MTWDLQRHSLNLEIQQFTLYCHQGTQQATLQRSSLASFFKGRVQPTLHHLYAIAQQQRSIDSYGLNMATTHAPSPPKPGFLRVAGEIRNKIYRMLLTNKYAYRPQTDTYAALHPAILRVSHQIYSEAINILHKENMWIIVELDTRFWPVIERTSLKVFKTEPRYIRYPYLRIRFAGATTNGLATFIIGQESIKCFVQGMWRISEVLLDIFEASSLALIFCKTPFYRTSRIQSQWLNPLSRINNYKKLEVSHWDSIARIKIAGYILRQARMFFSNVANIDAFIQKLLGRAHRHYQAERLNKAASVCTHNLFFLVHVLVTGRVTLPNSHLDSEYSVLWTKLQWIKSLLAQTLVAVGKFDVALRLGKDVLRSPLSSNRNRVQLTLCFAHAYRDMNRPEDEWRLFQEALNIVDDKSTFLTALTQLFPEATPEHARLIAEQRYKIQMGKAIDLDAIVAFWETV